MDESDHLTLVNAGDEEVVSQEEGGRGVSDSHAVFLPSPPNTVN